MRALIVEHNDAELPGLIGQRAEQVGIEVVPMVVSEATRYPDPREFDFIVPLGAPESVRDTHVEWIPRELDWLRRAVTQQVPVLGICFGAQMLSAALGGEVLAGDEPEIGWQEVDSLVPELVRPGSWFQLHFDIFTVPPGAQEVARNASGAQGFTWGPHLGVQFHPEITSGILQGWMDRWPKLFRELGIDRAELVAETERRQGSAQEATFALFDEWVRAIAGLDVTGSGG